MTNEQITGEPGGELNHKLTEIMENGDDLDRISAWLFRDINIPFAIWCNDVMNEAGEDDSDLRPRDVLNAITHNFAILIQPVIELLASEGNAAAVVEVCGENFKRSLLQTLNEGGDDAERTD